MGKSSPLIQRQQLLPAAVLAIPVLFFFKNAWVCDDAFIVFRVIDQWFAGNGPNWNFYERVQAYTSPLWFLLQSALYTFSKNHFLNVIALSAVCFAGAIAVLQKLSSDVSSSVLLIGVLLLSNACLDFSSSGLEYPLIMLLLALWVVEYDRCVAAPSNESAWQSWMLLGGLLLITRHDLLTLIAPALLYPFLLSRPALGRVRKRRLLLALGALPLAWSAFAVLYYGFPFPNPAYAKLTAGVPSGTLLRQGIHYLASGLSHDPLTIVVIASFLVGAVATRGKPILLLAAGVLLNLGYVVWVGGDFMRGRFLVPAFFLSAAGAWILLQRSPRRWTAITIAIALTAYGAWRGERLSVLTPPVWGLSDLASPIIEHDRGIVDERFFYFRTNSLFAYAMSTARFPYHLWCRHGYHLRNGDPRSVHSIGVIGMTGWCAGTRVRLIDEMALADPLLARLPVANLDKWRIGHYQREVPLGYRETIASGDNLLHDAEIRGYYEVLSRVTRSPDLLSVERLQAIAQLNIFRPRVASPPRAVD